MTQNQPKPYILFNKTELYFESQELCFYRRFHYCHFKHQASALPKFALFLLILHSWVYAPFLLPVFWLLWAYFYKNTLDLSACTEFAWLVGNKKPYAFVKYKNHWLNAKIECILQNNRHIKLNIYLPYSSLKTLEYSSDLFEKKQQKLDKQSRFSKESQKIKKILSTSKKHANANGVDNINNQDDLYYLFSDPLIDLKKINPEARYFLNSMAKATA